MWFLKLLYVVIENQLGKWPMQYLKVSEPGGKTWIRPYWHHILNHLPKFITDFWYCVQRKLDIAVTTSEMCLL